MSSIKSYLYLYAVLLTIVAIAVMVFAAQNTWAFIAQAGLWITIVMNLAMVSNILAFSSYDQLKNFCDVNRISLVVKIIPNQKIKRILAVFLIVFKWFLIVFGAWKITNTEHTWQLVASLSAVFLGYILFLAIINLSNLKNIKKTNN